MGLPYICIYYVGLGYCQIVFVSILGAGAWHFYQDRIWAATAVPDLAPSCFGRCTYVESRSYRPLVGTPPSESLCYIHIDIHVDIIDT